MSGVTVSLLFTLIKPLPLLAFSMYVLSTSLCRRFAHDHERSWRHEGGYHEEVFPLQLAGYVQRPALWCPLQELIHGGDTDGRQIAIGWPLRTERDGMQQLQGFCWLGGR